MEHDFHEEADLGKVYDSRLMKRLLPYLKPYRWIVLFVMVLIVGESIVQLAGPYLFKIAIDEYIRPASENPALRAELIRGLLSVAALYILMLLGEFTLSYFRRYRVRMVGQYVMRDLRLQIFRHLQRLHVGFFDRNPVGRLMTRVMGDVDVLNEMFTEGVIEIFGDLFKVIAIMIAMLLMNWRLALITFTVLPLIFGMTLLFQINVRRAYREGRKQLARINAFLNEHLMGMSTVQMFVQEARSFEKFDERNRAYLKANLRSIFYFSLFLPIIEVTGAAATALIVWYGGNQLLQGAITGNETITFGILVAFIQYSGRFFWPIRALSEKYNIFQAAMASSERIFALLDTRPLIENPPKPIEVKARGAIAFDHVWFAYDAEEYVLRDVSFTVNPGETVAIVGATGSGKTTIINLLCRFYDIQKGQILIDGHDIRDYKVEALRSAIAIVQQDVFLFSGTIESNITLNHACISSEQVREAGRRVHVDKFVQSLPEAYGTEVQERGSTLSVGQKQLIAFARALAHDPRILILDEATSSVDTETELMIQDALQYLMQGRTSLVVAHRLSTIRNADKILVMHKGHIRESGTHAELLEQHGIYYRLYQLQYKGQELSDNGRTEGSGSRKARRQGFDVHPSGS